jgi:hypothetical protein
MPHKSFVSVKVQSMSGFLSNSLRVKEIAIRRRFDLLCGAEEIEGLTVNTWLRPASRSQSQRDTFLLRFCPATLNTYEHTPPIM